MSNKPPIEVPQGAIRLNTDSQKLEFFAQDRWYEMATDSPLIAESGDNGVGARGIFGTGTTPGTNDFIGFINIASQGNEQDFGDAFTEDQGASAGLSSRTRGIFAGGQDPSSPHNEIQFLTISSKGDTTDFGDLTATRYNGGGLSNSTRGCFVGGVTYPGATRQNIIAFVNIATTGNAKDFGDIAVVNTNSVGTMSDSHGGLS